MTRVNMGIKTGSTRVYSMTKVNMGNRIYKGIQYDKGKHGKQDKQ